MSIFILCMPLLIIYVGIYIIGVYIMYIAAYIIYPTFIAYVTGLEYIGRIYILSKKIFNSSDDYQCPRTCSKCE